jgi:hypothetical protein
MCGRKERVGESVRKNKERGLWGEKEMSGDSGRKEKNRRECD